MSATHDYSDSYDLRTVIMYGAAASSGLIFFVLTLMFLYARSPHPPIMTDTIGEMVAYSEFFFFSWGSFFLAAIATLSFRDSLKSHFVSWIPVSVLGSLAFSFSFLTRIWIEDVLTRGPGDPFRPAVTLLSLVGLALVSTVIFAVVTSVSCAVMSSLHSLRSRSSEFRLR